MPFVLLLAFIAVPLIEIAVFIEVGGFIGLGWTLVVVVLTALAGTAMLRWQGLSTLRRAQETMAEGRMPLREVFDGLCLLIAGALLLTPGFVTDLAGGLLFLPTVRTLLGLFVAKHVVAGGDFRVHMPGHGEPPHAEWPEADGDVIDADYEEVVDEEPKGIDRKNK
ncbi:MAG: FxsA family protein [Alphaproteobacteria bacterium]|jgi:UPF0716 protein FxsA|nr:FxsA family protein [Alphaproteobacteria bacterium]MDP6565046.1 FxsA family protein [Alphaproteobacteria bacterium]MDP6815064.1 FxsA family protein [Alphaproteobacteria bacterium]